MKLSVSLAFLAFLVVSADAYTIHELPALSGYTGSPYSVVRCLNNNGLAGGWTQTSSTIEATKWTISALGGVTNTHLAAPSGFTSMAIYGCNDSGYMVGQASGNTAWPYTQAVVYGSSASLIPGLLPDSNGYYSVPYIAYGISANNTVTGEIARHPNTSTSIVVSPSPGFVSTLAGTPTEMTNSVGGFPDCIGYCAVTSGATDYIVGQSAAIPAPPPQAVAAAMCVPAGTTSTTSLGYIGPIKKGSVALSGNSSLTVVGYSFNSSGQFPFMRTSTGTVTALSSTAGVAESINVSGNIVGWTTFLGVQHAFLYSGGTLTDLNSYLAPSSGWVLNDATAINDSGWIVGTGTYMGNPTSYVLIP